MSERGEKSLYGVTTLDEVNKDERQSDEADDRVVGDTGKSEIALRNLER